MENERPRIVDDVILVIAKRDNIVYSIIKTKSVGLNEKRKSIPQFIHILQRGHGYNYRRSVGKEI
jgi:hypothetical protein